MQDEIVERTLDKMAEEQHRIEEAVLDPEDRTTPYPCPSDCPVCASDRAILRDFAKEIRRAAWEAAADWMEKSWPAWGDLGAERLRAEAARRFGGG